MNLSFNDFKYLPPVVYSLHSLKNLHASFNQKLESLDPKVLHLRTLVSLELQQCGSLRNPPYDVCLQGLAAIRQYYKDLAKGIGFNIPSATVVVIGQSLAGKTKLINTLKSEHGRRALTQRASAGPADQATKVFNVEEVEADGTVLRFIDMGGHEIYHLTYQLAVRENCLPLVVVNLVEYQRLIQAQYKGELEAARILCFDWLSHLYLACPKIGPPRLVLTHTDKLRLDEFQMLKQTFLNAANKLRDMLVNEEQQLEMNSFCQITHLSDCQEPIFTENNIFAAGPKDDYAVYEKLKLDLVNDIKEFQRLIPAVWETVHDTLQSVAGPYQNIGKLYDQLMTSHQVTKEQLDIVLAHLHDSGELLWYGNVEALCPFVFCNISMVTKLLKVLFDCNANESWAERLNDFRPFITATKKKIFKDSYNALIQKFLQTGSMDQVLLYQLISTETDFQGKQSLQVAVDVLKTFRLLWGPLRGCGNEYYVLPYFMPDLQSDTFDPSTRRDVIFHVELLFHGLSLPRYIFDHMTVEMLQLFPDERDTPVVKHNGATIYHRDSIIRLTHDVHARKVTIEVTAVVRSIAKAWLQLMNATNSTIKHTLDSWSACSITCVFLCPHCLIKDEAHPVRQINPSWCILSGDQQEHTGKYLLYSGMEAMKCGRSYDVPSPLIYPCKLIPAFKYNELANISFVTKTRLIVTTNNVFMVLILFKKLFGAI